ncbi:vWA domain-containing protein [Vibrio hangzhouensis]|uniref:Ca-activated chloride channel family protein n=1 Tax=Vibrio hangzhouensis TaxID=462991 RepID=A0A1H5X6W6_9VIBR|nr:VWA domain-containing protein [Vibrio hangzhouensis]SEG07026.1 Ca-activated chloride channel family protein [Vibrio hangzhouensis]
MFELENPGLLLLLPLPYLIYRCIPDYQTKSEALSVPFFGRLVSALNLRATHGAVSLTPSRWQRISLLVTWLMLVFAAANPMWLAAPQTHQLSGRDLMLVVDLSGSMSETDFIDRSGESQSRLAAAKSVLTRFSEQRDGDRLGLILFGDAAYLQSPFTADHQAWLTLLKQVEVGMAGESTHLGDAVGLAIKTYQDNTRQSSTDKVVIVLTDGNDTNSLVPPIDAAKVAKAYGIRLYMVAMGSPNTSGDQAIDFETMVQMAKLTGGKAFLAMSPDDLNQIYQTISELEPKLYQSFTYQPKTSLHYLPVLMALLNHLLFMFYRFLKSEYWSRVRVNHARSEG